VLMQHWHFPFSSLFVSFSFFLSKYCYCSWETEACNTGKNLNTKYNKIQQFFGYNSYEKWSSPFKIFSIFSVSRIDRYQNKVWVPSLNGPTTINYFIFYFNFF
jgi:hypothetical protein